jgi:type II secretory ATPase GspE/PulE/Tfp pilus assembly ATPase PilB-like protein
MMRLGDALQQLGMVSAEQLEGALSRQRAQRHRPLGEILIDMGAVTDEQIRQVLARKLGIPFVDVQRFTPEVNALKCITPAFALRHKVLPLHLRDQDLAVAMADPLNQGITHELRVMTGRHILPVFATAEAITRRANDFYGHGSAGLRKLEDKGLALDSAFPFHEGPSTKVEDLATRLFEEGSKLELIKSDATSGVSGSYDRHQPSGNDNTLVQLVNKMIGDARATGVSDIHIETYPGRQNTRVRFRRDGLMTEYLQVPHASRSALVSRIKVMASMDISEHRKPQDGKIELSIPGASRVELRVTTVPTTHGLEDVVLRILASSEAIPIGQLGLESDALASLDRLAGKAHGLLLVCGPTGSGKTTTLHSLLGHMNTAERKIWTAEDPIEITQAGLRQVHVNAKIGWTFAAAMRTFLRADPDVIMVGEMRDEETARTGIEASLTGHLVLSTLHTNSAPESITRLLDLGMDPFNFADALLGVLSQRLVRKFCPACRGTHQPAEEELRALSEEYCHGTPLHAGTVLDGWKARFGTTGRIVLGQTRGCDLCQSTGYRGRIGIHELLVNSPALKQLIQARTPVADLAARAMDEGMRTLKQDGILKVLGGLTDMAQVRAACN